MSNYELLKLDVQDYVATVTLNRPPVNALSMALYQEIRAVFDEISERADDVRVAVLTASGKYFCVGRDMKHADNDPQEVRNAAVRAAFTALYHCAVPVIAAVNGPALGGGLTLVLDSDIIIASDSRRLACRNQRGALRWHGVEPPRFQPIPGPQALLHWRCDLCGRDVPADGGRPGHHPRRVDARCAPAGRQARGEEPRGAAGRQVVGHEVEKILDFEQAYRAVESRVTLGLAHGRSQGGSPGVPGKAATCLQGPLADGLPPVHRRHQPWRESNDARKRKSSR